MKDDEKRFSVTISLNVEETVDGQQEGYHNSISEFFRVDYEGVVNLEKIMVGALNQLTKLGDEKVKEKNANKTKLPKGPKK